MSYTLRYGKTYEEWAEEKAKRIYNTLKYYYEKKEPVRLKDLVFQVYRERLIGVPILRWKPVFEIFTDFKPSPFIKNFINFLIEWLISNNYLDENTLLLKRKPTRIELIYSCLLAIWREY